MLAVSLAVLPIPVGDAVAISIAIAFTRVWIGDVHGASPPLSQVER